MDSAGSGGYGTYSTAPYAGPLTRLMWNRLMNLSVGQPTHCFSSQKSCVRRHRHR